MPNKFPSGWMNLLRQVKKVLGGRGSMWLVVCVLVSISLSAVEYGIAGFLQLFLVSLGYVDPHLVPKWLLPFTGLSIVALCLMLLVIGLFRAVALFMSAYSNEIVQEQMNARFRLATIYEMLMIERRDFLSASEVHHRMGEIFPMARHFVFTSINLFVTITQILLLLVGMLLITWKESLVGFTGLGLTAILVVLSNRVVAANSKIVPSVQKGISKGVERVSRNWLFVRISRTQSLEYEKLVDRIADYYHYVTRASLFTTVMLGLPPFFGIILFAMIIFLSRTWFGTSPANLVIFLYLFLRLVQHLGNGAQHFGQSTTHFHHFTSALKYFFSLKDAEVENALLPSSKIFYRDNEAAQVHWRSKLPMLDVHERPIAVKPPSIEVSNLSYSWAPGDPLVLDNLSLSVAAGGEILGIVGPSGSGKSTLMLLVLGMLEPTSGTVMIDGEPPSVYFKKHSLQLGYVGAEPFLIEGTLRDNLTYGLPFAVTDEEIQNAIERAQLTSAVASLAAGMNHLLDENGSGLSTGQKQRLALARALLRKPVFLVLDEASANLDVGTESDIARTIKALKGTCTVLIVSHRTGILEAASKVISLEADAARKS